MFEPVIPENNGPWWLTKIRKNKTRKIYFIFFLKILKYLNKYKVSEKYIYNWNLKSNSLSTSFDLKNFRDLSFIYKKRLEIINSSEMLKFVYELIDKKLFYKNFENFIVNKIIISKKYHYFPNVLLFRFRNAKENN